MKKCPGRDLRFRDPSTLTYDLTCTNCGASVEFWYDDRKRPCHECKETVQPDLKTLIKYHNCASSCHRARECLGDEDYLKLILQEEKTTLEGEKELEKILGLVPADEKNLIDFLTGTIKENLKKGFLLDFEADIESLKTNEPTLYRKIKGCLRIYLKKQWII